MKHKQNKTKYQALIGLIILIVLFCGIKGWDEYYKLQGLHFGYLSLLYFTIQLFAINSSFSNISIPIYLEIARFLAPILTVIAFISLVFFSLRKYLLRMSLRNHTIICGLGPVGEKLAKDFLENGKRIIIIESDETNDYVSTYSDKGVVVLTENAADKIILKKARVKYAKNLIAVTHSDKLNVEIAHSAFSLYPVHKIWWVNALNRFLSYTFSSYPKHKIKWLNIGFSKLDTVLSNYKNHNIKCFAHVNDNVFNELLTKENILNNRFSLFNITELGSRLILKKFPPDVYWKHNQKNDSPQILIIGYGRIGENILKQLCLTAHYKNNLPANILIIANKDEEKNAMLFDDFYKENLKEYSLINITFEYYNLSKLNFNSLREITSDKIIDIAYLCIEEDIKQFKIATNIEVFFENNNIEIVLCMPTQSSLMPLLERKYINKVKIKIFNIVEESCQYAILIDDEINKIAQACHDTYCHNNQSEENKKWNELDSFSYYSNLSQADHIDVKLRVIDCEQSIKDHMISNIIDYYNSKVIDNDDNDIVIEKLAEMEHRRWMCFYILNGWKSGPTKEPFKKIHNNIVDWNNLSEKEKEKDRNHIKNIPQILEHIKK